MKNAIIAGLIALGIMMFGSGATEPRRRRRRRPTCKDAHQHIYR